MAVNGLGRLLNKGNLLNVVLNTILLQEDYSQLGKQDVDSHSTSCLPIFLLTGRVCLAYSRRDLPCPTWEWDTWEITVSHQAFSVRENTVSIKVQTVYESFTGSTWVQLTKILKVCCPLARSDSGKSTWENWIGYLFYFIFRWGLAWSKPTEVIGKIPADCMGLWAQSFFGKHWHSYKTSNATAPYYPATSHSTV